ncbi:hypothetical protein AYO21_12107 [Fonsecaea monophora]|uniref:VWFA domain-containing protein n=1 Tax=Fonsecaea monophora TaxID=254056 RepID=A0A177EQS3_9EURO|nr:hypothetical protein AYO21_12107 [Fonsecaea monophora]KAH0829896.1 von Willebrand factor type A domain containing protein [Fonsecaea pedrosoi]OAG33801.1 hypothetical protein AYO21_12107 [Fonsecaea monophora]
MSLYIPYVGWPSYVGNQGRLGGIYFVDDDEGRGKYLPQSKLSAHSTIYSRISCTTLRQSFVNYKSTKLDRILYTFPLNGGIKIVHFQCTIGSKTIVGNVKARGEANAEYQETMARGRYAVVLERMINDPDVFTTSLGSVEALQEIHVVLRYVNDLEHHAETGEAQFTLPSFVAPRYGYLCTESAMAFPNIARNGLIDVCIDVTHDEGSVITGIQSPTHPIQVTLGRTSRMDKDSYKSHTASATLVLGIPTLDHDLVFLIQAQDTAIPRAMVETHPTIPNQRAVMVTLEPKKQLPRISPEIVFIVDRSGSMQSKIPLLRSAMHVFVKSLPVGVKFNICSFGTYFSFFFQKSVTYDKFSLDGARNHLDSLDARYGGSDLIHPVKATIARRLDPELPLEILILTDGDLWSHQRLFNIIKETPNSRFFSLGIGPTVSASLIDGIANAGGGFSQFISSHDKMDKAILRMLKGALTPHVTGYAFEFKYADDDAGFEQDFGTSELQNNTLTPGLMSENSIPLIDLNSTEAPQNPPEGRYDNLPSVPLPKYIQAPHGMPALYPNNPATVYLLLSPGASKKTPKSVVFRGTTINGPLIMEFPVQDIGVGTTIHKLAAMKAIGELEDEFGWLTDAKTPDGQLMKSVYKNVFSLMVEREAVRLGVLYQVGGQWSSFVAVETMDEPHPNTEEATTSAASASTTALPTIVVTSPGSNVQLYAAREPTPPSPPVSFNPAAPPLRRSDTVSSFIPAYNPRRMSMFGLSTPDYTSDNTGSVFGAIGTPVPDNVRHTSLFGSVVPPARDAVQPRGPHAGWLSYDDTGKMYQVLILVEYNGAWHHSGDLVALLGLTESRYRALRLYGMDQDGIRATALSVAWLKLKVPEEEEVWDLIVEKAMQWLTTVMRTKEEALKAVAVAKSAL